VSDCPSLQTYNSNKTFVDNNDYIAPLSHSLAADFPISFLAISLAYSTIPKTHISHTKRSKPLFCQQPTRVAFSGNTLLIATFF